MSEEKPSENDEAKLHEQWSIPRPAMNWNRANGGGLRTSLRGSRLATASQIVPSVAPQPYIANSDDNIVPLVTIPEPDSALKSPISDHEFQQLAPVRFATETTTVVMSNGSHGSKTLEHEHPESSEIIMYEATTEDFTDPSTTKISDADNNGNTDLTTDLSKQESNRNTQKHQLCILNAPNTITEENIRDLCDKFDIAAVEVRHIPGRSDNVIYISLVDISEARRMIDKINSEQIKGHKLHIDFVPNDETTEVTRDLLAISKTESVTTWHELPQFSPENQMDSANKLHSTQESEAATEEGEICGSTGGDESDPKDSAVDKSFSQHSEGQKTTDVVVIDSDEDDAMITDYADARQATRTINASNFNSNVEVIDLDAASNNLALKESKPRSSSIRPQILADLTIAELELQVRYFYITRDPATIPETDPVRCLVCAGAGHLESWCPAKTCSHCKKKDVHFSKDCPKIARCSRCRGHHLVRECKYKLRPQNFRVVCDLCNEKDHLEGDCELNWRSSGAIWKKPLPPLSVIRTCFICGDSGHLGNDCRLRQPGKQMGSSMWSEKGLPNPITLLTPSIDRNISTPVTAKKKHKMPNSKAKGVVAAPAKFASNVQPPQALSFDPSKTQGWPELIKSARSRKGAPANIQIKGLANRTNLQSRPPLDSYPPTQGSLPYREYRENQTPSHSNGYSISSSNFNQPDRNYHDDDQGTFIRGRASNSQYRPRSRSRSPRRWYRSPPRATNYNTLSRNYRDRDDANFSGGGNIWRSNGR